MHAIVQYIKNSHFSKCLNIPLEVLDVDEKINK